MSETYDKKLLNLLKITANKNIIKQSCEISLGHGHYTWLQKATDSLLSDLWRKNLPVNLNNAKKPSIYIKTCCLATIMHHLNITWSRRKGKERRDCNNSLTLFVCSHTDHLDPCIQGAPKCHFTARTKTCSLPLSIVVCLRDFNRENLANLLNR